MSLMKRASCVNFAICAALEEEQNFFFSFGGEIISKSALWLKITRGKQGAMKTIINTGTSNKSPEGEKTGR